MYEGSDAEKWQQCYYALYCLGGDRLTPKVLDHYLHHNLVMLQLLWCFVVHLPLDSVTQLPTHCRQASRVDISTAETDC